MLNTLLSIFFSEWHILEMYLCIEIVLFPFMVASHSIVGVYYSFSNQSLYWTSGLFQILLLMTNLTTTKNLAAMSFPCSKPSTAFHGLQNPDALGGLMSQTIYFPNWFSPYPPQTLCSSHRGTCPLHFPILFPQMYPHIAHAVPSTEITLSSCPFPPTSSVGWNDSSIPRRKVILPGLLYWVLSSSTPSSKWN